MNWMIMPFKRYADFEGRSRRMEFWSFQLLNLVIGAVLVMPFMFSIFIAALSDPASIDADPFSGIGVLGIAGLSLYGIYALGALIPSIAVTVRRFHDQNLSGWWYLGAIVAGLIPFIGFIASIGFLVVMFLPGTSGPNQFGPDPKDPYSEDVFA